MSSRTAVMIVTPHEMLVGLKSDADAQFSRIPIAVALPDDIVLCGENAIASAKKLTDLEIEWPLQTVLSSKELFDDWYSLTAQSQQEEARIVTVLAAFFRFILFDVLAGDVHDVWELNVGVSWLNSERLSHVFSAIEYDVYLKDFDEIVDLTIQRPNTIVYDISDIGTTLSIPSRRGRWYEDNRKTNRHIGLYEVILYLTELMAGRGYEVHRLIDRPFVRRVLEHMCECSPHPISPVTQKEDVTIQVDGVAVTLGIERFLAVEILFQPGLIGLEDSAAITNASMFDTSQKYDPSCVLTGDLASITGLTQRLQSELRRTSDVVEMGHVPFEVRACNLPELYRALHAAV